MASITKAGAEMSIIRAILQEHRMVCPNDLRGDRELLSVILSHYASRGLARQSLGGVRMRTKMTRH